MNELLRRRKRLTELEVQSYLAQMVSALKYLHSHRVIHRDIKLGNLFLNSKMEIKLGDFGLATKLEFEGERKRTICGTPNYIAPEILDGKEGHSYEVDLWSLGVLLYTVSIGRPPFETHDIKLTYRRIKLNAYSYPESVPISDELKDLISKLIVTDPLMRIPLDEVMQHEFMKKNLIPKYLPTSTLACPPSDAYLKQFMIKNSSRSNSREIRSTSLSRISDELKSTASKDEEKSSDRHEKNQSPVKITQQSEPLTPKDSISSTARKIAVISNYTARGNSAKIYVKKWVDYSNKYGLGYLLSNGSIGIYFNDNSKLVCSCQGDVFHVFKPQGTSAEVNEEFKLSQYPAALKKKITLLEHFRKYLVTEMKSESGNEMVFVKKWMQTEHATVFRLSDKTVQIRFLDKTELVLSTELKTVAFIDKTGTCEVHPLKSAVQSDNKELSKRINYTTEMITRMLNPKTPT
jgi:polo-like kinase 1